MSRTGRTHNAHRTPPKPKRPEAIRREMKAREELDNLEAAEELKKQQAIRRKL